jgi:B9 domain-containing protein 1
VQPKNEKTPTNQAGNTHTPRKLAASKQGQARASKQAIRSKHQPSIKSKASSDHTPTHQAVPLSQPCSARRRKPMTDSKVTSTVQRVLATNTSDELTGFLVLVSGQVELGRFPGLDNLYCKYDFTYGPEWRIVHGIDKGISQIASKAEGGDPTVVWNFPIDVVFKSTSAHGWPRLIVSVFGIDGLGRDVVRGYGSIHLPTHSGKHPRTMRMFRPVATSWLQRFLSWMRGTQPEFFDSRFVSRAEGREVTVVQSAGSVRVVIHVMTRGMQAMGYHDGRPRHISNARSSALSETTTVASRRPSYITDGLPTSPGSTGGERGTRGSFGFGSGMMRGGPLTATR